MPASHVSPPTVLDRALEVGSDDWQGPAFYQLMTALVVSRPIGWISTISASGVRNIAPYSSVCQCSFRGAGSADRTRDRQSTVVPGRLDDEGAVAPYERDKIGRSAWRPLLSYPRSRCAPDQGGSRSSSART